MSNIIVECRNKDAQNPIANGDWTTYLKHNITLEEGDQVVIKDSFIDTQQATSENVLIEKDVDLLIDVGFYQMNVEGSQQMYRNFNNTGAAPDADFQTYILCLEEAPLTANDKIITAFSVKTTNKSINSAGGVCTLRYTDMGGVGQNITAVIPEVKGGVGYVVPEWKGVIFDDTRDLVFDPPLSTFNLEIDTISTLDNTTGRSLFIPYLRRKTIRITAGNYDPDELCTLINTEMTINSVSSQGQFYPTNENAILQTGQQIQRRYFDSGTATIKNHFGLCKGESGDVDPMRIKTMESFPTGPSGGDFDVLFGSSQFELAYDQASGRFLFKYTHMPFYHQNTINTAQFAINTGSEDIIHQITRTGGIFFGGLYAEEVDGLNRRSINFWEDSLGFNLTNLVVRNEYTTYTTTVGGTNVIIPSDMPLEIGQKTTGQLAVLDGQVNKTTPLQATIPVVGTPHYSGADSTLTESIFSEKGKSIDALNQFGYYLIEINSQFKNNFLTEDNNFNHIQQIVNRYYELNSYTSGESGQIVYQHSGEPTLLQSFHCRILTSDKQLATNVGDDNTIHLQIVKAPRIPQPPPKEKK
tara:strand:+ start:4570 stop:6318 length:1749 start_codon:yes stop_codon:yes gene_type:complete